MSIQYATPEHLPQLLHIEEQSFLSDLIDEHKFKEFLKSDRNGKTNHLLVDLAEFQPTVITGYILIITPKRGLRATIHSFAVLQNFQGQKIGEKLIEKACAVSREAGFENILTYVRVDNPHAINRYKKSGFHIIGAEANYYEDGCDAVKYLRKLI